MSTSNSYYKTLSRKTIQERKNEYSVVNKEKAQVINFAELKRIMLQNVSRSTSRTYIEYTQEQLASYMRSPLTNIDNIRAVSQFLYRISGPYKNIIDYFANMGTYSYNLTLKSDISKGVPDFAKYIKNYQKSLQRLENMRLKAELPVVIATVIRDGVFYGFCCDDEESFFINALDPKYCKINAIRDGVYDFAFNLSYFDQGNNSYFVDSTQNPDGLWDDIFVSGYKTYKDKGRDFMWIDIPPEKGICVLAGDDPICPLPYFVNVFPEILTTTNFRSLLEDKAALENTILLISKIPMSKDGQQVNDFLVDLDLVIACQDMIDEVAPDLVATAYTPCDVEKISFNNENQVSNTNYYSEAVKTLFDSIGVSEMQFNSDKGGSVGLAASIISDETNFFRFLSKLESWLKRYVYLNISEDILVKFHYVTYQSRKDYITSIKDAAALGLPVKMDYATALGFTPFQIMQQSYFEKSLGLEELWTPLSSSYTQTGNNDNTKEGGELTGEGIDTRDAGKNKGTKARKGLG